MKTENRQMENVPPFAAPKGWYVFGDFRLNVAERSLLHSGTLVSLPPKVFDTLVVLVENSGRLLEKDELMRRLWPDSFVEDASLARKISYLRQALNAHDPSQPYIETVPKIGYRFVAEVAVELEAPPVNGTAHLPLLLPHNGNGKVAHTLPELVAPHPRALLPWHVLLLGLAVLVVLAGSGYWALRPRVSPPPPWQNRQTLQLTKSGQAHRQALSPDGKYAAFVVADAQQQSLWVQQTATGSLLQLIPPAAVGYRSLTFSPDGNYLYFTRPGQSLALFRLATLGGPPEKLWDDIGSPPAFSPDGKQLAFVRHDSGQGQETLRLANVDGTGERVLAHRKLPNRFSPDGFSWSPDGQSLAIGVEDYEPQPRQMHVATIRVADGKEIPLGTERWYRVEQVVWTGDGQGVIAVAWDPPSGILTGQLWYLPWPTGTARRLTNDLNDYKGVSVSAEGATVATIQETRTSYFWLETVGQPGRTIPGLSNIGDTRSPHLGVAWLGNERIVYGKIVNGNADLWAMDVDGKNQQRLTNSPEADLQPATTADGRTIVYASFRANHQHLWRMDADGNNARQLTDGHDETMPALTAAGDWLFYLATGTPDSNLRKLPLVGGEPIAVGNHIVSRPALSPDGKWIAGFMAHPANDERGQLTVLSVNNEAPPRTFFVRQFFEQNWIQWSPDSRAIRYLDQQNGVMNLRSQPLDGGPSVPLTHFREEQIFRFAWSHDGQSLVCERGKKIRDVVLFKAQP